MVATQQTDRTTAYDLKIDGALLGADEAAAIEEIAVDQNLHLPAMLTIRVHVDRPQWTSDTSKLIEGKRVEMLARQDATPTPLFVGKITAVELDLQEHQPLMIVRAYDLSYGLHRVRKRRSFIQVTDGDLARRLAGEAGLSPVVDSTSEVFEYIFQQNVSDYEFLRERARRVGYDFYVDNQTLYFKRPHQTTGQTTMLEWGVNLKRFRLRTTLAEPVSTVRVHGWDPKAKRVILGQASSPNGIPKIAGKKDGKALAATTWSQQTEFDVVDEWVASAGDAQSLAQAYIDELGGSFIEAEGECDGAPDVRPGREVKVDRVGDRFKGTYYVTAAHHSFSTEGGLRTRFSVRSRRAGTVSELVDATRPRTTINGPVIGIVTNINDPEKKGRIKVKFPWLSDTDESHWARLATPLTGKARGFNFLPEVNDEVLVDFVQGDINHPYIIGGLWNGLDEPPVPPSLPGGRDAEILIGGAKVKNRLMKSTKGNMLIFNDSDNAPGVFLVGSSGAYVMVDDENGKEKIALTDKTKQDRIEIRSQDQSIWIEAQGPIHIKAQGNISIETQGNLEAKATGNATIEAQGNLTAKANGNASVEASANLTLKGANVSIEAMGQLNVKGGIVNVTSSGPAAIKGTPLALN